MALHLGPVQVIRNSLHAAVIHQVVELDVKRDFLTGREDVN